MGICVGTCIKNGREASKYMQVIMSDESGALLLYLSDSVESTCMVPW